jgi:predicted Zn-dependent protease
MRSSSFHNEPSRLLTIFAALVLVGCAINPATGKRQISLISESQEIQMGREADGQLVASMGLYDDPDLQAYVQRIGENLAAVSERPHLPWTFRVVDEPVVNAFALPGGYIYVTRGILAYFNSEAELAAVLGHEIGHVTARHSVNQMSKQQLAGLGLSLGRVIDPEMARYVDLAETPLGLLFLKFGRDDERQADDLGLRYMVKDGYAPAATMEVFDMLGDVSRRQGAERIPGWLSTHPAPENREGRMESLMAEAGLDPGSGRVEREAYLRRIDGLVYGEDPRQGYFRKAAFYHPEMAFRFDFPDGWETINTRSAVAGRSPEEDAVIQITLAAEATPAEAARKLLSGGAIRKTGDWKNEINGLPAVSFGFETSSEQGGLTGLAAFLSHQGKVFAVLGYAPADRWTAHLSRVAAGMGSFRRLTDPARLGVEPMRLQVVELPSSRSLATFHRRSPSSIPLEDLAVLNHVEPAAELPAGRLVKRVVGGP